MGFFKDFKADLTQAVNELSDDAVKMAGADKDTPTNNVKTNMAAEDKSSVKTKSKNKNIESADKVKTEKKEIPAPVIKQEEKAVLPEQPVYAEETETHNNSETAIITAGLCVSGDINSEGSVELYGSVEGNVECKGKLTVCGKIVGNATSSDFYADKADIRGDVNCSGPVKIGPGSVIIGNLTATSAVIAGAIKGDIDVHGPVIVDTSAIVMGNIKSKLIQINNGAVIEGYCSQCYSENSPKNFFADK